MGVTQIKEGFNRFKSSRMSVESDQYFERLQTARNIITVVGTVKNLIMKDCLLTVRETAEQVEVNTGPPHVILCDHAHKDCETCPQASVDETEKLRLAVSQDLLNTTYAEPGFL
ncbi:hypothetical protein TNCV_1530211 [Trichonephila clavipes]|uniref:Uncharacterized protein n=1 Tax=Trichonephila clavipes TaxID=2585209 RepID=A0A8X6VLH3_TRICX|nr:hypothetical protein TNCV_1530211 [Trichonephila clavipes]